MAAEALTLEAAPEDTLPDVTDRDGPDPRTWPAAISGYKERIEDLAEVQRALEMLIGIQKLEDAGEGYNEGMDFLRKIEDQLKGDVARMILVAFKVIG